MRKVVEGSEIATLSMGGRTDQEQRMGGSSEGSAEVGDHEYAGAPTCKPVVFTSSTHPAVYKCREGRNINPRLDVTEGKTGQKLMILARQLVK